jgi:hypothetical protein
VPLVELAVYQEAMLAELALIVGHGHKDNLVDDPGPVGARYRKEILQIDTIVMGHENEVVRLTRL